MEFLCGGSILAEIMISRRFFKRITQPHYLVDDLRPLRNASAFSKVRLKEHA